jgi:hypothetical protein
LGELIARADLELLAGRAERHHPAKKLTDP